MSRLQCAVSERCPLTPYVTVWANGVSAEAMAPFRPKTPVCRRHVGMLIEHAISRSSDVRIERIGS